MSTAAARWTLAALLAAGCATAPSSSVPAASVPLAGAAVALHYELTVPTSLEHLDVRLCIEGARPTQLMAASGEMVDAVTQLSVVGSGAARSLPTGRSPVELGTLEDDDCIHYRVAGEDVGGFVPAMDRIGDALLTDTRVWLWRPPRWDHRTRVTARVALPEGYSASLPWARDGERFVADASALGFAGNAVFGRLDVERLTVAGASVEVVVPPGLSSDTRAAVAPWVESAVVAAAGAFGRFPTDRLQVVLVPRPGMVDAIGFGLMRRGGGASARLVVSRDAGLAELRGAWTAIHEFSHLLHHFVDKRDAWLSEGIATYYQEVLRARAGLLAPEHAWLRIHRGALKGSASERSLRDESAAMFSEFNFARVYWGGAAMALQADVALRTHAEHASTLDAALEGLTGCCGVIARPWSCVRTLGELDRLTGTTVFAELLRRAESGKMPDLTETFAQLGVRVQGDRVSYHDAPLSHVRDAIMASRVGSAAQAP